MVAAAVVAAAIAPATAHASPAHASPAHASPAHARPAPAESGVTVQGPHMYDPQTKTPYPQASTVTVNQTASLVNQFVTVSWTNFTPSNNQGIRFPEDQFTAADSFVGWSHSFSPQSR
jgi:hypothetical protein